MVVSAAEEPTSNEPRVPQLEHLSTDQMRLLAYASAIGKEFDFPLLAAAMGAEEEPLAEQVERLTHLGILRERVGGDRFAFTREETRARIYQGLTASRLRVLHRKIAEAMEKLNPNPSETIVAELGRHYFLGRIAEKSYQFNRRAAQIALGSDAPDTAAHHLERARMDLRSLPGDRAREAAQLAIELGDVYFHGGDLRSADRMYSEGLDAIGQGDAALRARLLLARSEVARENLDVESAGVHARAASALFRSVGDASGEASVHRVLGRIAYHQGAYREALEEGMQALETVQRLGDNRLLGRVLIDIGNAFVMMGPEGQQEAVEWYERAIERLTESGDWAEVARAYTGLATAVGSQRPADALEHLARGREFAERAHEPRWVGWALFNTVEYRLALGQVEEAQRDNQLAGKLLERSDDPLGVQQVARNRGMIAERRGLWEEAEAAYHEAVERAERLGMEPDVAEAEFLLARLLYKTRDVARAREAFNAAARHNLPKANPLLAEAFHELGRNLARDDGAATAGGDAPP